MSILSGQQVWLLTSISLLASQRQRDLIWEERKTTTDPLGLTQKELDRPLLEAIGRRLHIPTQLIERPYKPLSIKDCLQ